MVGCFALLEGCYLLLVTKKRLHGSVCGIFISLNILNNCWFHALVKFCWFCRVPVPVARVRLLHFPNVTRAGLCTDRRPF